MKNITLLIFIIVLITSISAISCEKNGGSAKVESSLENLDTPDEQKGFLLEIGESDQFVRSNIVDQIKTHGHESPEHRKAIELMVRTDSANLANIERYLQLYGHPEVETHGTKATDVPIMVIHHAIGGMAPRLRNFEYLYGAYQDGEIEATSFSFYLNRMYQIKYGEMIQWDRPFTVKEELDTLFKALDLP